MRWITLIVCAAVAPLLGGCAGNLDLPSNFVELPPEETGRYDVKAVSADGVLIALRRMDNPKNGTADFWAKAVENELTSRGHSLIESVPVTSESGSAGRLLTFTRDQKGQSFTYILGVFVKGKRLLIAEAGGKTDAFDKRKAEISKSLLSVR